MIKRLALIIWWLGLPIAVYAIGSLAMSILALIFQASDASDWAATAATAAIIAAPFWAVSFVLGGSFWKPPKP